ncbi:unnamed protein product [Penicillium salamii]|nr:unnamed protein product [Penicillium salamii]CAG8241780.1 unnamed protein product [Penicillium salamii]
MKIIDPQTAVLTNVEVLAYLTSNPPRRPPNPPGGNWVPNPDLRDHNTVIKEIHNYASRLSPHLLRYPRYTARPSSSHSQLQSQAAMTSTLQASNPAADSEAATLPPPISSEDRTPMDNALYDLIVRLQPYGLTKAEVVMILNLGLGLGANNDAEAAEGEEGANGDGAMEVDEQNGEGEGGEDGEDEQAQADYTAEVLLDAVVEERELRLSDNDMKAIFAIIRETLTADYENVKG